MACSNPDNSSNKEDMLSCPVCLEWLTEPHILTECLHTYCKNCVEQLKEKQRNKEPGVSCPMCRIFTAENQIRLNFFVKELIYKEREKIRLEGKQPCKQCSVEEPADASWKCQNCRTYLCDPCKGSHLKIPLLKGHTVSKMGKETDTVVDHLVFCSEHTDKPIEFYCEKCKKAICITCCQVVDHKGHDIVTVQKALEKMVPHAGSCMDKVEETIDKVTKNIERVEEEVAGVERSYDCAMGHIDKKAEQKIDNIRKEQTKLNDGVRKEVDKQLQHLRNKKDKFLNKQQELTNLKNVTKISLECAGVSLLNELVHGTLFERLEKVTEEKMEDVLDIRKPEWRRDIGGRGQSGRGDNLGEVVYNTVTIQLISGGHGIQVGLGSRYWTGSFVEVFKKQLKQIAEIKIDGWCKKITVGEDKVWAPLYQGKVIYVYTLDGHLIKSIKTKGGPTCVEKTPTGEFMISCDNGMFLLYQEGNLPVKICDGSYSDVCVFGRRVFSLAYKINQIVEFVRDEVRGWVRYDRVIPVGLVQNTGVGDTLLVRECTGNPTELDFFVCVLQQHTVYQVNSQGHKVRKYGSKIQHGEGGLKYPSLCGSGSTGEFLVADRAHRQYKVLNTHTGRWVSVFTADDCVFDAQLVGEHTVWFSRHIGRRYVLTKHKVIL